jgi:hypothetical protein
MGWIGIEVWQEGAFMSEIERSSTFRQQWLTIMTSLAACFAIFGVKLPTPSAESGGSRGAVDASATKSEGTSTKEVVTNNEPVTITPREWDDPLSELDSVLRADREAKTLSPGDKLLVAIQQGKKPEHIKAILKQALADPSSKLLIVIQIVAGPSHLSAKRSRTLWGHAFRMALSDLEFKQVSDQTIAAFQCNGIKTVLPLPEPNSGQVVVNENEPSKAKSLELHRSAVLPMKLYEWSPRGKQDPNHKCFVLNLWLMDEYLGEKPWLCLGSIYEQMQRDLIDPSLASKTILSMVGPGGSSILKKMKPEIDADDFGQLYVVKESILNGDASSLAQGTRPEDPVLPYRLFGDASLYWVNAHCTVPTETLWGEPNDSSIPALGRAHRVEARQPIEFIRATPDDGQLLDLLAQEIRLRLQTPWLEGNDNKILLFYEQNSDFGMNLCKTLETLLKKGANGKAFQCVAIPYLRGVGSPSTSKPSESSDADIARIQDYFRRTLDELHRGTDRKLASWKQPVAIGILGGEVHDKLALLHEVRYRYPQSLAFTNDLKIEYLDPKTIPVVRNLIVAAHAELMPKLELSKGTFSGISFRDEVQSSLWYGYQQLMTQVFGFRGPVDLERPVGIAPSPSLYEVGSHAFQRLDQRAVHTIAGRVNSLLAVVCIGLLFGFPWWHAYWTRWRSRADAPSVVLAVGKGEPSGRVNSMRDVYLPAWFKMELLKFYRNLPIVVTCVLLTVLCIWPLTMNEAQWFRDSDMGPGWASMLNNTTTWFTGVSVIPSVLLLVACLPFTFWPAIKKEIERAFSPSRGESETQLDLRSDLEMDLRIEAIRASVHRIQGPIHAKPSGIGHDGTSASIVTALDPLGPWSWKQRTAPIVYAVVGVVMGWPWWRAEGDAWVLQMSILATISASLTVCKTVRMAVFFTYLVSLCIAVMGWLFNDYAAVPARDPWVRVVGSCVFAVAYWWLLVGLVKLFIHQWFLRKWLREGTKEFDRRSEAAGGGDVDPEVVNEHLKLADAVLARTQTASQLISRDLSQLSLVGLVVCLARMPWFDAWGMSVATWLTIVLPMAAPFVSSIVLRRRGFEFRDACMRYLSQAEFALTERHRAEERGAAGGAVSGGQEASKKLAHWLPRYKSYHRGVFSPLDQDPLVSTGLTLLVAFSSGPQGDVMKRVATFFLI